MTQTITPVPKPQPRTEAERLQSRIASVQKLRASQKPIKRSGRPSRSSGPPKKKPRKPSEFARIYGSRARVQWVKSRPCLVANHACMGHIENAHTTTGGMGRKSDAKHIVPLCAYHHRKLHAEGPHSFERQYGVSLAFAAAQTEMAWRARLGEEGT